jgi:hypothetical protein
MSTFIEIYEANFIAATGIQAELREGYPRAFVFSFN